jgi:Zn-dependent metalloprotease
MACEHTVCFIIPPHILARVARRGDDEDRDAVLRTIATTATVRTRRSVVGGLLRELGPGAKELAFLAPPAGENQTVYDLQNAGWSSLPGTKVRGEGDPPVDDPAVNEVYDNTHATYDFYNEVFGRDSLDGKGLELISSVHYGDRYDNAAWTGTQMIYGDGGRLFSTGKLTGALDVVGHELTHGVTDLTAGLVYEGQPGAANEHFSDALGSMVKQHAANQSADQADWLIGEGTTGPALGGVALRSMKEPGSANKHDIQPGHMDDYADLPIDNEPENDNGGVHINSGIPNRAFYLAATAAGGNSWETVGPVWYQTLTERLERRSDFKAVAEATVDVAGSLGQDGALVDAVGNAWREVGVL